MMLRNKAGSGRQSDNRRGRMMRIAIPVCILLFMTVLVAAKFIHTTQKDDSVTAKDFYFTSDILDGQTHTIAATETNGTAKLVFSLKNHVDELRYSQVDVNYTVSAKDSAGVPVTLTGSNSANVTGTLSAGSVQDQQVTITGLEPGKTYTVTALTENYYKAVLTGTVQVKAADEAVYSTVRDGGAYIEVSVWTVDYSGQVSLSYPAGLIPDNTGDLLKNAKTAASGTADVSLGTMNAGTSHVLRFFKPDSSKTYASATQGKKVVINEK